MLITFHHNMVKPNVGITYLTDSTEDDKLPI
ncbi:unnamed protein product [Oikopleura dioica]|uniref:Uncharacterized protein n=1 Tax=Oikopleura dioica TaxID=34765 RepID=E4YCH8_OIKDI|nr:unnamed protein product [Oikopleura dioica]